MHSTLIVARMQPADAGHVAALTLHHLRLGQAKLDGLAGKASQIAAQQRREGGIERRGCRALVLAESPNHLAGERHVHVGQQLGDQIPEGARILLVAGGGSLRENGVLEQVKAALAGHICRCSAYPNIIRTVMDSAAILRGSKIPIDDDLREIGAEDVGAHFQQDRGQCNRSLPLVRAQIGEEPFHQTAVISFA